MKTADFAQHLASCLMMYLPGQLGLSENTIMVCRDAFKLVLVFAEAKYRLRPEFVPIMASTANTLNVYFSDNGLSSPENTDQPLFTNHHSPEQALHIF